MGVPRLILLARPGVYLLKWERLGAIYVGASWRIRGRVEGHLWRLRRNRHEQRQLQRAYFLGGEPRVVVRYLQVKSAEELRRFEQRLLEHWVLKVGWRKMLNEQGDVTEISVSARRPASIG